MNLKKTLFLAVVLLAAVGYIYYVILPGERSHNESVRLLGGTEIAAVHEIEVTNQSGTFTLENRKPQSNEEGKGETERVQVNPESWVLKGASYAALEPTVTRALLSALADFKLDESLPTGEVDEDRAVYGLKNPEIRITVRKGTDTPGAQSSGVELGKMNEYLRKRYASRIGSSGVFLTSDVLFQAAKRPRADFRNKQPISFGDGEISKFTVSSPRGDVEASLIEGRWKLTSPQELPASESSMNGLTRTIRGIRVNEIIDEPEDLARYGLATPTVKVRIAFTEKSGRDPLELQIGRTTEENVNYLSLSSSPVIFKIVGMDMIDQLSKSPNDLRERQFLTSFGGKIEEATFAPRGAPAVTLAKQDSEWKVNGHPADEPFVRDLLRAFTELRASGFSAPGEREFGLGDPELTVTFKTRISADASPESHTLKVGSRVPGKKEESPSFYAVLDDGQSPFTISEVDLKRLTPREETLRRTEREADETSENGAPLAQ